MLYDLLVAMCTPWALSGVFGRRKPWTALIPRHNWKEQRAITKSVLREFGMGKSLMADKIATELQIFTERQRNLEGKAIHLPSISSPTACNIVCSITFGNRFDYDDEYCKRMMKNSDAYLDKAPLIWVCNATTFFKKLPDDLSGTKEYEACIKDLNENFYEANLVPLIKSFIVAGTETTSMTLNWCVLYCLHHPEIQEKVFDEIKTHVGTARPPYESVWENPDQFNPERFLDASGNLLKWNKLIPSEIGRHISVGEAMARVELDLFLAFMFQRFQFELEDSAKELSSFTGGLVLDVSPEGEKSLLCECLVQLRTTVHMLDSCANENFKASSAQQLHQANC
ncbi:hypothetical protein RRG08_018857 [Elysia crispata]|uniref:Cytochrome P450 n=1 Tax=Elysia crispata TaxID=231223 RepID=A0AAE1B7S5_9GAST|nr:hypothetical protein RRG08_018857 [Elysia crispata]